MSAPRPATLASRPDKRKHPRRDVIGTQLVSVDVDARRSSALVLDASEGGMALQLSTPLTTHGKPTFSFLPPDQAIRIQFTATPVWNIGDRIGIAFSDLDQRSRSSLKLWLARLPLLPTGPVAVSGWHSHDAQDLPSRDLPSTPRSEPPPALDASTPPPTPAQESLDSIVSRARILLCGTGVAVAWRGPEGMVCRASDGNAPPAGVPVDINRGLSGECVRTSAVVRCDDTESDPRVDPDVCRQLRLRSAIIVPITGASGVLGLVEVFSDKPRAFSDRDIPTLRTLAAQLEAPAHARFEPANTPPRVPLPAPDSIAPPPIPIATRPSGAPSHLTGPPHPTPPIPPYAPVRSPAPPASLMPDPTALASEAPAQATAITAQPPAVPVGTESTIPDFSVPSRESVHSSFREIDQRPRPVHVDSLRRTLASPPSTVQDAPTQKPKVIAASIITALILAGSIYWFADNSAATPSKAPQAATPASQTAVNLPEPDANRTSRTAPSRRSPRSRNSRASRTNSASTPIGVTGVQGTSQPDKQGAQEAAIRPEAVSQPEDLNQAAPPVLSVDPSGSNPVSGVLASSPTAPDLDAETKVSRVSQLKLVRRVTPKYPQSAFLERRQGAVMLRLTVGSDGRVKNAKVLTGDDDLAQAALDAVRQWRYQPYKLDGNPVEVTADAIITFSLNR